MGRLPSGTVTFLFTDIEGSTQLWEKYPEAMQNALTQHDSILRESIESNHGHIIKTTGGTGKTRLSLQLATDQLSEFREGVWLVELAPLADPAFIVSNIADVLELHEVPGIPLINILVDYLHAKHLLLIFDNCEHLVEESAQIADQLLHACPQLKIIASSREALGIAGETVYRVPTLSLPDSASRSLMDYESTRLFIERAARAEPRFHVTYHNASSYRPDLSPPGWDSSGDRAGRGAR